VTNLQPLDARAQLRDAERPQPAVRGEHREAAHAHRPVRRVFCETPRCALGKRDRVRPPSPTPGRQSQADSRASSDVSFEKPSDA